MSSQQTYNALWESAWGDLQRYGPVHRHSREALVRTVQSLGVTSILDVGCGSGENLLALAAQGTYALTGVDISEEALAIARRLVPSARLRCLDVERDTLPEQFDLVMSHQAIEHMLDDVAALRHLAAMSRRYVLVSTMQGRMRPSELRIGHVRNYSEVELRRKLELAGLRVRRAWGWGFPFYSPLIRTATEWLPGGAPLGPMRWSTRVISEALYHVYRLNWPGKGDVLHALAEREP